MWTTDAVSKCGHDPGFICHLPISSCHSHYFFSLSYMHVARYPCPPVAYMARFEYTEILPELANKGSISLESRTSVPGRYDLLERNSEDVHRDPRGSGGLS